MKALGSDNWVVGRDDQQGRQIDESVDRLRAVMLFSNGLRAVPFNVVIALVLVLLFYGAVPEDLLGAWFALVLLISSIRFEFQRRVLRSPREEIGRFQLGAFAVGSTLTGLFWGGSFVLFDGYLSMAQEMLLLWALGGLTAGAFSSMATHGRIYLAFVLSVFVPALGVVLFKGGELTAAMGALLVAFVVMLLFTHATAAAMLREGLRNRVEKEVLAEELQQVNLELTRANVDLEDKRSQLQVMAATDELTGLPNRRSLERFVQAAVSGEISLPGVLSVVMLDIDKFKHFNDEYGHRAGDQCLRAVAQTLGDQLRYGKDRLFRYGGEELLAVLPEASAEAALAAAARMCAAVRELEFRVDGERDPLQVTISGGIATGTLESVEEFKRLVGQADQALYRAKRLGRNRVVQSESLLVAQGG